MAVLTVQSVAHTGLSPTYAAAASGGDSFANDGKTFFVAKNGGGASVTVTVNSQQNCSFGFDHDLAVAVPAGEERWIGPFLQQRFSDANNRVTVTYSAVTSVTVAAVKVAP